MSQVSYDSRAMKIDGRRVLLFSGAIHYPRSTPAMWPQLLARSLDELPPQTRRAYDAIKALVRERCESHRRFTPGIVMDA